MESCVILVDNTNLFIGGQQLSAQRKGIPGHDGHAALDRKWRLNFEGLKNCLADGRKVYAAVMVGSVPEDAESAWEKAAEEAGFTVVIHDISHYHQEKQVDTELVARGTEIICTAPEPMTLIMASGDRDYLPLYDVAHRNGWKVEVCAFTDSFNPHGELADAVDVVRPLDECLYQIGRDESG